MVEWLRDPRKRQRARGIIGGARLRAPAHLDAEVLHSIRGLRLGGIIDDAIAHRAMDNLARSRIVRVRPGRVLLGVAWELRHNLTAYDALYVALADLLDCGLVTADGRLASAPDLPVPVTVL